jgi:hypothetical protein
VTGSGSHGVATNSSYTGVSVSQCDLVSNGGNGVNNYNTSSGTYVINASNNWWGDVAGPAGPSGDGVSANVTVNSSCSSSCGQPNRPPAVGSLPPSRQDARQAAAVKRPD